MARLELTRSTEDKRLYVLPGVGQLRTRRWPGTDVEATANGQAYTFRPRRRMRGSPTATDAAGGEVGRQDAGGPLIWRDVSWELVAGDDLSYYTLIRSGEERGVANLAPALWNARPVPVVLDERAGLDPGLVLFALYVMRMVAEEMNRTPNGGGAVGIQPIP